MLKNTCYSALFFLTTAVVWSAEPNQNFISKAGAKAHHVLKKRNVSPFYTEFGINGAQVNTLFQEMYNLTLDQDVVFGKSSSFTVGYMCHVSTLNSQRFELEHGLAYNRSSVDLLRNYNVVVRNNALEIQKSGNQGVLSHNVTSHYLQFPVRVRFKLPYRDVSAQDFTARFNNFICDRNITLGFVGAYLVNSTINKNTDVGASRSYFSVGVMNRFKLDASLSLDISPRVSMYMNYTLISCLKGDLYKNRDRISTGLNLRLF